MFRESRRTGCGLVSRCSEVLPLRLGLFTMYRRYGWDSSQDGSSDTIYIHDRFPMVSLGIVPAITDHIFFFEEAWSAAAGRKKSEEMDGSSRRQLLDSPALISQGRRLVQFLNVSQHTWTNEKSSKNTYFYAQTLLTPLPFLTRKDLFAAPPPFHGKNGTISCCCMLTAHIKSWKDTRTVVVAWSMPPFSESIYGFQLKNMSPGGAHIKLWRDTRNVVVAWNMSPFSESIHDTRQRSDCSV